MVMGIDARFMGHDITMMINGVEVGKAQSIDASGIIHNTIESTVTSVSLAELRKGVSVGIKELEVSPWALMPLMPSFDIEVKEYDKKALRFMRSKNRRIRRKWEKRYTRLHHFFDCVITGIKTN